MVTMPLTQRDLVKKLPREQLSVLRAEPTWPLVKGVWTGLPYAAPEESTSCLAIVTQGTVKGSNKPDTDKSTGHFRYLNVRSIEHVLSLPLALVLKKKVKKAALPTVISEEFLQETGNSISTSLFS